MCGLCRGFVASVEGLRYGVCIVCADGAMRDCAGAALYSMLCVSRVCGR